MSQIRVDDIVGEDGVNPVDFSQGINAAGIITAASFTGTASSATVATNSYGLTGSPTITVTDATVSGNLTVNGSQTIIATETLEVGDKNVGIASTTTASNVTANDAGIVVYGSVDGSNDKTLLWNKDSTCFEYNVPLKPKGLIETVAAASTHETGVTGRSVLELDCQAATVYRYAVPATGNIGIVSFKNMPADAECGTTITVLFTQHSTTPTGGIGNTVDTSGIGTYCNVTGISSDTVAGISTRADVGTASTVTLSAVGSDSDFVSFFVHYTGGTNTDASSYKIYVTKNGGFRPGLIGV
jgi:hypothetical protein